MVCERSPYGNHRLVLLAAGLATRRSFEVKSGDRNPSPAKLSTVKQTLKFAAPARGRRPRPHPTLRPGPRCEPGSVPATRCSLRQKDRSKRSMLQVYRLEAIMRTIPNDDEDKINDLTSDLEDLKTTVEELQVDPPTNVDAESLQAVKAALQQASDATDEIEDQQDEDATSKTDS